MLFRALAVWFLLVSAVLGDVVRHVRRGTPVPPQSDSFFLPPNGWEDAKPGTVLATRKISAGFAEKHKIKLQNAYQILYRTSGINPDTPMVTVTTVLVPDKPREGKLVMMMPYEDSNYIECAPSYHIQLGSPSTENSIQTLEELLWTSLLNDGWIVTLPDHEGPQSAFSSGMLEGYASLDALRATLGLKDLNMPKDAPIVGLGYSGGAIAGGWAAALHDSYAPELNVAGWAIGGTPVNLTDTVYGLSGGLFAGLSAAGIAGLVDSYPDVNKYVGSVITQDGNTALQYTREHCMADILIGLKNVQILNTGFMKNGNQLLSDNAIKGLLSQLTMGSDAKLTPKAPMLMYHAQHDEVISYKYAKNTAQAWCKNGAKIIFQTYNGIEMGHVSTEVLNTPNVLGFVRDRMGGKQFPGECQFPVSADPLWQPDVLGGKITETLNAFKNFWGGVVGRGDKNLKEHIGSGKDV